MSDTIFIFGAGCSVPYGFPSGESLVNQIIEELDKMLGISDSESDLAKLMIQEGDIDTSTIKEFRDRLYKSGAYSIDSFLSERKEFRELGKQLIALILYKHEVKCKQNELIFNPQNPKEHWYRYFFNEIKKQNDFNFSIYTFNYDRSLEYFFIETYRNYFAYSDEKILDLLKNLKITHLHGSLGEINTLNNLKQFDFGKIAKCDSLEKLEISSEKLEIIYEVAESNFKHLHEDLRQAKNIVFLGFGFDRTNMTRINLTNLTFTNLPKIYATTFGLTENEVNTRLKGQIKGMINSFHGSNSRYFQVEEYLETSNETAYNFIRNKLPSSTYSATNN